MIGWHEWDATETPDDVVVFTQEPIMGAGKWARWRWGYPNYGRYIFYREFQCSGCGKMKNCKMQGTPRKGADYS